MWDIIITNWLGYVVTAVVSLSAAFLYYKQERNKRDLENANQKIKNDSDANSEWQRIVEERNREVDRLQALVESKDDKIAEIYKEKGELRTRLEAALRKQADAAYYRGLYEHSRCDIFTCPDRKPPFDISKLVKAEQALASAEENIENNNNNGEKENDTEQQEQQ